MDEPGCPMCLVFTSPIFRTPDAIVLTGSAVITVDVTITSIYDSRKLVLISSINIPPSLPTNRPRRYHVFIADREGYAKALRERSQRISQWKSRRLCRCGRLPVGLEGTSD